MAKAPEDAVVRILREIQATQAEHTRILNEHSRRFDELQDSVVTALGLSAHANVRHESVEKRLEALAARVDALEARE